MANNTFKLPLHHTNNYTFSVHLSTAFSFRKKVWKIRNSSFRKFDKRLTEFSIISWRLDWPDFCSNPYSIVIAKVITRNRRIMAFHSYCFNLPRESYLLWGSFGVSSQLSYISCRLWSAVTHRRTSLITINKQRLGRGLWNIIYGDNSTPSWL